MARGRKVVPFRRGARRHPKWDMGAPNPRGKIPLRPRRGRTNWPVVLMIVGASVIFGPVALDAASLTWRQSEGCKVWMVVDGDTVKMTCPAEGYVSGRILGFDTPEMKSRCPTELVMAVSATFYLRWQLWTAGKVVATPRGKDRYGRVLTLMAVDDELVGTRMVGAGLARWYDGGKRRSWCGADG